MKIIYVHDTKKMPYSIALVKGYKKMETRNKNTLDSLANEDVLVARTMSGKPTVIVGKIRFSPGIKLYYPEFREQFNKHLVPYNSKYDCKKDGYKWCYEIINYEPYDIYYPLPKNIIRHGRIYAEIKE